MFLHVCQEERWHVLEKFIHKIYKSRRLSFPSPAATQQAVGHYLRSPFTEANKVLEAFVKDLRKTGTIAGVVHKRAISKEQLKKLFESGELGPTDSLNPNQLQLTVWLYLSLFFGRRGREKPATPAMFSLRKTPQGVEYYELNRSQPGS